MALIVQKYGGSSLRSPHHIRDAARRITETKARGHDVVAVVSAMGRATDYLIRLARRTVAEPPQRELDMLMTAGERVSMALLAMALDELGVPAISFTGSQSGIITTSHHTEARILEIRGVRVEEALKRGLVVIIAGFQGVSREKEVTTLGRGGSDTTAVALAAALGAKRCEVFTDVDGLFTADPRCVAEARLISRCSYEEGLELASLGAKMHPRSMEMARRFGVALRIAASDRSRNGEGTQVGPRSEEKSEMEETRIRGVAAKDGYHLFRVASDSPPLWVALKQARVPVRFFSATEGSLTFLCEKNKAAASRAALKGANAAFEETADISVISAVGEGLTDSFDALPDFLQALHRAGVTPLFACANSLSVSAAIPTASRAEACRKVHALLVAEGRAESN